MGVPARSGFNQRPLCALSLEWYSFVRVSSGLFAPTALKEELSVLQVTNYHLQTYSANLRTPFFFFSFFTLSFYRVLINDTRCSPREARRLGNRRFSLSSQAYVDFSACPPSLCIFIEYQPRISYSFLFVPMFPCRVFLPGIRNRVKLAKKTFRYSDQTRDRKLKYTWDSRSEIENRQTDRVSFFFRICMLFQWLFKGLTGW